VDVLQVKLTGKEPPAGGRHNPPIEARQAYMEGQYYLFQNTDEALVRKVESFTRATELDPGYAEPHFGLAQHYLILALFFHTRPREAMPKALAAADRAIQIDPQDWRGYYIRGVYRAMFDHDWTCAGRDLDRAVEMHPAAAMARHGRAFFYLIPLGRTEEALKEERLALESDPLSIPVRGAEALLLYSLGRDQDAAQRARTGLGLFPGVWVAAWIFGHVLNRLGFADEAAAAIENALGKAPQNPWLLATLALTHSRRGQSGEAAGILGQLEELSAHQYVSPLAIALANAGYGEVEGTFRYLDRAVEERDPMLAWFVRDPLIAKLPAGGRYQALLHSMNLA